MAPGRKRLSYIQLGKESTAGTAVAATAIWRGMGSALSDDREIVQVEELIAIMDGAAR